MQRYEVERRQAARVAQTALHALQQLVPAARDPDDHAARFLVWAARLHEVGISVAHASYHKHSAYILDNADMPGFSRRDQALLARLVLAHRGKLERMQSLERDASEWTLIFCLRLAVLLHRSRDDQPLPPLAVRFSKRGFRLDIPAHELDTRPLTAAALAEEARQWATVDGELLVQSGKAS
jgi:exopolyphosphatase/guanosine-5'-triphosphate,3'-diphosphate pyrophosphatase